MTKRKDWPVEYAVQAFMLQVDRHDNIKPVDRKPTTSSRFWQAGYSVAWREAFFVLKESMDRTDSPAHALADMLKVMQANLELEDVEDRADQLVAEDVEGWLWPVSESGA